MQCAIRCLREFSKFRGRYSTLKNHNFQGWEATAKFYRFAHDRKPQILRFSSRVHWIFRFAGARDFAVKSTRELGVTREARLGDRKLVFQQF